MSESAEATLELMRGSKVTATARVIVVVPGAMTGKHRRRPLAFLDGLQFDVTLAGAQHPDFRKIARTQEIADFRLSIKRHWPLVFHGYVARIVRQVKAKRMTLTIYPVHSVGS